MPTFQAPDPAKCVILIGHPRPGSLASGLAHAYAEAWEATGGSVEIIDLSDGFGPLDEAPDPSVEPSPAIARARQAIQDAGHLAVFAPVWWGSFPARLQGFISHAFSSGFAFQYRPDGSWDRRLAGRSARVVMTCDAPVFFQRFWYLDPGGRALKWSVLWFCGFKPVRMTSFGRVLKSTPAEREGWMAKVRRQAKSDAERLLRKAPRSHRRGSESPVR
ncbi:MAG: NAD(P)H-dependent oxidoreductase [Fimbriimonadaceae bacterium]|nr:NAD(P)H-dependent oxidoreductase [Fimbriimonadaceae bacterium]